jgi:WD40 repeat protein
MSKGRCYFIIIFVFLSYIIINATSLDGTSSIKYPVYAATTNPSHYVFRDRDLAQGAVFLRGGFTVLPGNNHGSNLFMDTNISVSGIIDLRSTSTMTLLGNLYLDSGVTFSDSGRIYSRGPALVMNGDLTIPGGKILHCGGEFVIDGCGHTLHFNDNSQLFLDDVTTLTLRNIIIKTNHSYPGTPAVSLSSNRSKLALDNVVLSLGDDWNINRGQLFIHNDVMVTGTSALVYRSPSSSFVCSHGCLYFDNGTTFSYAPASTSKDLIIMSDESSSLVLDGCSLKSTHTGLRLTKGRLYLNDHVQIYSGAVNKLSALSTADSEDYGTSIRTVSWTPNGRFVAIGGASPTTFGGEANSNELQVYSFNGTALTAVTSKDYGTIIYSVAWSPDGKYLAIGGNGPTGDNELQIYSFSAATLTAVTSQDYGTAIYTVAWSPDGRYLAVGGTEPAKFGVEDNTNELQIYTFDGKTLIPVISQDYGTAINSVAWSPDGKYLAIGGNGPTGGNELHVYSFNNSSLSLVTSKDYGTAIYSAAWSPDGVYLAIGGTEPAKFGGEDNTNELQVYSFNGTALTAVTSQDYGTAIYSVSWSCNGRYLAIGGNTPSTFGGGANSNELQVYNFNSISLTAVTSQDYGTTVYAVSISPDNKYLALGGTVPTGDNELWVDTCAFVNETATQAVTNSVVFGNGTSSSDLDINVLAGARVEVYGNVFHNAA